MKDLNRLETHIKSLAENQQSTPPPLVWTEIDKALPTKKNNRKSLLFLFLIGALILVFSVVQFNLLNLNNSKNIERSYSEKSQNRQNLKSKSEEQQLITQTDLEVKKESSLNETLTKNGPVNKNTSKENRINQDNNFEDNKVKNTKLKIQQESSSLTPSKQTNNEPFANNFSTIKKQIKSTVSDKYKKTKLTFNSTPTKQLAHQNENPNKLDGSTNQEKLSGLPHSQNYSIVTLSRIKKVKPSFFPNRNRKSIEFNFYEDIDFSLKASINSSDRNKYFFEFGSLIGSHDTHLDNQQDSINTFRSQSESNWYTWGVRISMGYHVTNSLYLKTGLEFIESRDKFSFKKEMIQLLESTSNFSIVQGSYFNRGDITYRQWNIPLSIGLEKQKGKFNYGLEASALFNMSFKSEGKVQVGEFDFSRVENEAIYKNRLGLGYRAALLLGVNLTERNTLYFKPSYAQYLHATSLENALVNSKLSQYYLEIAFRKRF